MQKASLLDEFLNSEKSDAFLFWELSELEYCTSFRRFPIFYELGEDISQY